MLGLELVRHTKSTQKVGTPNPFDWPLSGTYMQVVEIISLLNADQSKNQNIILCASIFETEQYHPAVICLCLCLHVCVCIYNRTVKINHQDPFSNSSFLLPLFLEDHSVQASKAPMLKIPFVTNSINPKSTLFKGKPHYSKFLIYLIPPKST